MRIDPIIKINTNIKMRIKTSDFYALIIFMFPICHLIGGNLEYYDEIIGIIACIYVFLMFVSKSLNYFCQNITIILAAISLIGFISNCISGLLNEIFPIFVDFLWLWKTFAVFIFFYRISEKRATSERVINLLTLPAKFVIVLMLVTSVISQFVDIGVSGSEKIYGLNPYCFFWNNGIQTGWLAFCCILILSVSKIADKTYNKYLIASIIPLFLTASSLVYCWIAIVVVLSIMMRKSEKFKIGYIIVILLGVCIFAMADIQLYFTGDESSVRKTLIEYGIKTANMYLPFGSGFATYGSEMALRYYSQLYINFGWENSWALGRDSTFLNDNFFASIVAQFGWLGFILYLFALFQIFKMMNKYSLNKRSKIVSIATVLTICAVMIGSASAKSLMGVCTFATLGLVSGRGASVMNEQKIGK